MDPNSNPAFFEQRRHTEPQAIIDALVEQTTRQGKAIYDLGQQVKQLTAEREAFRVELAAMEAEAEEQSAQGQEMMDLYE
jgi:alpha-D-ribose 1-methylphosphonate 5-triphosphate synthase subunit PhnG